MVAMMASDLTNKQRLYQNAPFYDKLTITLSQTAILKILNNLALLHAWACSSAQDPRNVFVFAIVFVFNLLFEAATRKTYLVLSPHQGTFDPAIKLKFSERLPSTPEISNK